MSVKHILALFALCVACGPNIRDEQTWMLGPFTSPAPPGGRYDAQMNVGIVRFYDDHTFVSERGVVCGVTPDVIHEGTWELVDDVTVEYSYTTPSGNERKVRLERVGCNEFATRRMNQGEWLDDIYLSPLTRGEMCSRREQSPGEDGELHLCDCIRYFCDEHPEPEPFTCSDDEFPAR